MRYRKLIFSKSMYSEMLFHVGISQADFDSEKFISKVNISSCKRIESLRQNEIAFIRYHNLDDIRELVSEPGGWNRWQNIVQFGETNLCRTHLSSMIHDDSQWNMFHWKDFSIFDFHLIQKILRAFVQLPESIWKVENILMFLHAIWRSSTKPIQPCTFTSFEFLLAFYSFSLQTFCWAKLRSNAVLNYTLCVYIGWIHLTVACLKRICLF